MEHSNGRAPSLERLWEGHRVGLTYLPALAPSLNDTAKMGALVYHGPLGAATRPTSMLGRGDRQEPVSCIVSYNDSGLVACH